MSVGLSATKKEFEDLTSFAKHVGSFSGALMALFTGLPFAGLAWSELMPPWPSGGYICAVVFSVLVIVFVFLRYRDVDAASLPTPRLAFWLGMAGLASAILYLSCLAFLTIKVGEQRHLTGFGLTEDAQKAIASGEVPYDSKELLAHFGYRSEERIWAYRTLAALVLLYSFCAAVTLIVSCFCVFVVRNFVVDKLAQQAAAAAAAAIAHGGT